MAFHTFDPTPIDGGSFSHSSQRFDWCALTDTKFLIVYQQISPARLFGQIVNFAGTTAAPTFGTAFVIASENISNMNPKVIRLDSGKAFVTYNTNIDIPTSILNTITVNGIVVNIDGSDNVTVLNNEVITSGVNFNYWGMALHNLEIAPFKVRFIHESGNNPFNRIISIDAITSDITLSAPVDIGSASDDSPYNLTASPDPSSTKMFFHQTSNTYTSFVDATTTVEINESTTIHLSQTIVVLTDDISVGSQLTNLMVNSVTMPEVKTLSIFDANIYHGVRLDDEHVIFAGGGTVAGPTKAYVFRITSEGSFQFIQGDNNPITITNGLIETDIASANGVRNKSMYHNVTNNLVHMTGIVDDTGTKVIGFHIFSPT